MSKQKNAADGIGRCSVTLIRLHRGSGLRGIRRQCHGFRNREYKLHLSKSKAFQRCLRPYYRYTAPAFFLSAGSTSALTRNKTVPKHPPSAQKLALDILATPRRIPLCSPALSLPSPAPSQFRQNILLHSNLLATNDLRPNPLRGQRFRLKLAKSTYTNDHTSKALRRTRRFLRRGALPGFRSLAN